MDHFIFYKNLDDIEQDEFTIALWEPYTSIKMIEKYVFPFFGFDGCFKVYLYLFSLQLFREKKGLFILVVETPHGCYSVLYIVTTTWTVDNIQPIFVKLLEKIPSFKNAIAMIDESSVERALFASLEMCAAHYVFHLKKNMRNNYVVLQDKSDSNKSKIEISHNYLFRSNTITEALIRRVCKLI